MLLWLVRLLLAENSQIKHLNMLLERVPTLQLGVVEGCNMEVIDSKDICIMDGEDYMPLSISLDTLVHSYETFLVVFELNQDKVGYIKYKEGTQ